MENKKVNAFKELKPVKDTQYVQKILGDVTGINLTNQEITKLKVYLRYENKGGLFDSINQIYSVIGANFSKPSRFIIIPFMDSKGMPHLNIQKI